MKQRPFTRIELQRFTSHPLPFSTQTGPLFALYKYEAATPITGADSNNAYLDGHVELRPITAATWYRDKLAYSVPE